MTLPFSNFRRVVEAVRVEWRKLTPLFPSLPHRENGNIKYYLPSIGWLRGVTVKPTGCGFDPHSRRWNIYLNLYLHFFALMSRLSAALSSATQHAMPPEFGRKWGTECLKTRFPLPTLLCAGYSVKLIFYLILLGIELTTCRVNSPTLL